MGSRSRLDRPIKSRVTRAVQLAALYVNSHWQFGGHVDNKHPYWTFSRGQVDNDTSLGGQWWAIHIERSYWTFSLGHIDDKTSLGWPMAGRWLVSNKEVNKTLLECDDGYKEHLRHSRGNRGQPSMVKTPMSTRHRVAAVASWR
jgi:hypothetical protein